MRRARFGPWTTAGAAVVRPVLRVLVDRDWRGLEHVPASGGVIVALNHLSYLDPFTAALAVVDGAGREPRFLAKEPLFRIPVFGTVLRGAQQIPVLRGTDRAEDALVHAEAALARGECVCIYPEGTLSRDPDGWPMRPKTGLARLALATGVPVVPVAQWGPQLVLPPHPHRLRPFPRRTAQVLAGPPVDLSAFTGAEPTGEVLAAVGSAVVDDLTALLAELRGVPAPAVRFDPRPPAADPAADPAAPAAGATGEDATGPVSDPAPGDGERP